MMAAGTNVLITLGFSSYLEGSFQLVKEEKESCFCSLGYSIMVNKAHLCLPGISSCPVTLSITKLHCATLSLLCPVVIMKGQFSHFTPKP